MENGAAAKTRLRQLVHDGHEALVLLAEHGRGGHAQVLEEELGRVLRLEAHLVELLALDEALHAVLHLVSGQGVGGGKGVEGRGPIDEG